MNRRSALKGIGGILAALALTLNSAPATAKAVLRIAHLTDVHLKNKFDAPTRFVKCLHHVQQQNPRVDLVLNGGDVVFDMNKENLDIINEQWKLWHNTLQTECSLPVRYCLGNHDIWWNENDKGQALYGKQYAWIS